MKNNIINNILERRSIRSYKKEQIPHELLEIILNCGINAPSALHQQPWEIRIIQNTEILTKINIEFIEWAKDKNLPGSASHANEVGFSVFHNAPTLIIVAADTNNPYSNCDCGMLAQNILLSAHSLNIGTCVIGCIATAVNTSKEIMKDILMLPDNYKVLFGIAIGYPNDNPNPKHRDNQKIKWIH